MQHALVLFEDEGHLRLLPLVYWRCVFELLVGRRIVLDRIAQRAGHPVSGVWTREWIAPVASQRCGAPTNRPIEPGTLLVNGRWLCDEAMETSAAPRVAVADGQIAYIVCDARLARRLSPPDLLDPARREEALDGVERIEVAGHFINYPWDIVTRLSRLLADDWTDADAAMESEVDAGVVRGEVHRLHVGESTQIHPTAILDVRTGPIYISYGVDIGAYSVLEGPLYIGPGTHVRPHTFLHGGNAIGPVSRIGGELDGCVIHSYTNKQHAGFLGHAYVGSWVNLGAGACNSDLKNTYGRVRVPLPIGEVDTGLQFFGAIIADHAKIGINASLPTGAVIGLAASIASTRLLPKFIPSYSWVTEDGVRRGDPLRLVDAAAAAMARRNMDMTDEEVELLIDLGERSREIENATRGRPNGMSPLANSA